MADNEDFNDACDVFTTACHRAANWRHRYFGARYSTRIVQAIEEIEKAIRIAKSNPEIAEHINVAELAKLQNIRAAFDKSGLAERE